MLVQNVCLEFFRFISDRNIKLCQLKRTEGDESYLQGSEEETSLGSASSSHMFQTQEMRLKQLHVCLFPDVCVWTETTDGWMLVFSSETLTGGVVRAAV